MAMRRTHDNPVPEVMGAAVWGWLLDWLEWRTVVGCPRSPRLPEGGALLPPSTAPAEPSRYWEFNNAFFGLAPDHRVCLLAVVRLASTGEWLKGEAWTNFFVTLELTPAKYAQLLKSACESLEAAMRQRGLLR